MCHAKFWGTMEIDLYGRCPFLTHTMSIATAFILFLLDNSLSFIARLTKVWPQNTQTHWRQACPCCGAQLGDLNQTTTKNTLQKTQ